MSKDPVVQELVDRVMSHATAGRPAPEWEAEDHERGNLAAMGRLQLETLLDLVERNESKVVFPNIIRHLYGDAPSLVEHAA